MSVTDAAADPPAAHVRPDDPHYADLVDGLDGLLGTFNRAGVLASADVHAARAFARLTATTEEQAVLGAAFAVRATRFGHVYADLDLLAATVADEDGRAVALPEAVWPEPEEWAAALARSPLVAAGPTPAPLHLHGRRLYLDRYWAYEHRAAVALAARSAAAVGGLDVAPEADEACARVFTDNAEQQAAARAALHTRLAVIAGGPGTGKTATVARLIGLVLQHTSRDGRPPRIALAAPTGKAAARLGESIREEAQREGAVDAAGALALTPTTVHRLLGGTRQRTRFRHHAGNRLPYDLVVIDEVSMVSLSMLTKLLEALREDANLVLVGDPNQLTSVEAGSVLGDIIGAATDGTSLQPQVQTLSTNYRSGDELVQFAGHIQADRVEEALAAMAVNPRELDGHAVSLVIPDHPGHWPSGTGTLAAVQALLAPPARRAVELAGAGDARGALDATMAVKVLCAHRRGPDGVRAWNALVEGWSLDLPSYRRPEWYAGRPVMVTRNDPELDVYNGDIGVVIDDGHAKRVIVDGRDRDPVEHRRLGEVQTVHAMTIHKSQGSQFDAVVVVLPAEASPILTRELLYTAVTRARHRVVVVSTEATLRRAIAHPVTRASALGERLHEALTARGT